MSELSNYKEFKDCALIPFNKGDQLIGELLQHEETGQYFQKVSKSDLEQRYHNAKWFNGPVKWGLLTAAGLLGISIANGMITPTPAPVPTPAATPAPIIINPPQQTTKVCILGAC